MKLEQGDQFEVHCASWLRAKLPSYESIWSAFIGHDGKGPLPMQGLSTEQQRERKTFYQAHYSFACACFELDCLVSELDGNIGKGTAFEWFLKDHRVLFQLMAYVGYLCELVAHHRLGGFGCGGRANFGSSRHTPYKQFQPLPVVLLKTDRSVFLVWSDKGVHRLRLHLNSKALLGSDSYDGILEMIPRPEGSPDPVPERAKMLKGCDLYVNGAPCPMCMSAIY
jgi:hypothetical protein